MHVYQKDSYLKSILDHLQPINGRAAEYMFISRILMLNPYQITYFLSMVEQ